MAITLPSPNITVRKRDIVRFDTVVINPVYTKATSAISGSYWDYLCPKNFIGESSVNPLEVMSVFVLGFPVSAQISNAFLTVDYGTGTQTIQGSDGVGLLDPGGYSNVIGNVSDTALLNAFGGQTTIANTVSGISAGTIPQFSVYNSALPNFRSYGMLAVPSYSDNTGTEVTTSNISGAFSPIFNINTLSSSNTVTITIDGVTDDPTIILPNQIGVHLGIIECICYPSPFYQVTWYDYRLAGTTFLPC